MRRHELRPSMIRLKRSVPCSAQLGGQRQLVEMPQTEHCQKPLCRTIQQGATQVIRPTHNSHQITLHQLPQNIAALHPANRLHFRPQHRLTIRHHGQGFHRRPRKPRFYRALQQPPQPGTERRPRQQLVTASHFFHPHRHGADVVSRFSRWINLRASGPFAKPAKSAIFRLVKGPRPTNSTASRFAISADRLTRRCFRVRLLSHGTVGISR